MTKITICPECGGLLAIKRRTTNPIDKRLITFCLECKWVKKPLRANISKHSKPVIKIDLENIKESIKPLLIADPEISNFDLYLDYCIEVFDYLEEKEKAEKVRWFKELINSTKKIPAPASVARAARLLREEAREGKETAQLIPSQELTDLREELEEEYKEQLK